MARGIEWALLVTPAAIEWQWKPTAFRRVIRDCNRVSKRENSRSLLLLLPLSRSVATGTTLRFPADS